jgi:hypothetical protein
MIPIELRAAPGGQPGYGELMVRGWSQGAGACELCIQRNQDSRYLGNAGGWDTSEVWHQLDNLREGSGCLLGDVGPWLVDALTHDQRYMLTLRNAQGNERGVLRVVGTLLSSKAAGNSRFDEKKVEHATKPAPAPEQDPIPAPAPIVAVPPPVPQPPDPAAKKGSKLPLILIVLLLALALAAAAWWFLLHKPSSGDTATAPSAIPAAEDAANAPDASAAGDAAVAPDSTPVAEAMAVCSPEALADAKDDLPFIQACLKSDPSSEQVLAVIAAAKDARRCGVMQRLYAHKAQSGDAAIAYAYAREYDPAHYASGGCIEAADGETAAYWYEIAVEQDPQNQDAQQRLKELSK